jgi:hypothetical protein
MTLFLGKFRVGSATEPSGLLCQINVTGHLMPELRNTRFHSERMCNNLLYKNTTLQKQVCVDVTYLAAAARFSKKKHYLSMYV